MLKRLLGVLGYADRPTISQTPVPPRASPSLAQEALLVSINPANGKLWDHARHIWSAALLIELAHEGRLEVSGFGRDTRHRLVGSSLIGDPDLDRTLTHLEIYRPGRRTMGQVSGLPSPEGAIERLVARGALVTENRWTVALIRTRRLRVLPSAGREEPAARVRSALLGEAVPDERTALLVAALAVGLPTTFLVPKDRVKEADRRKREIVAGTSEATRALISAVQAARERGDSGGDGGGGGGDGGGE